MDKSGFTISIGLAGYFFRRVFSEFSCSIHAGLEGRMIFECTVFVSAAKDFDYNVINSSMKANFIYS